MQPLTPALALSTLLLAGCVSSPPPSTHPAPALSVSSPQPLSIGETFTIDSRIMGEQRRINVFVPTYYGEAFPTPLPVLYMPDGGLSEDFLHLAGLVQVLSSNAGMRPFILVGIQNTSRRRDMTGPTTIPEDKKIAPVVGGSATFRAFIKDELMPAVRARYRTTEESAIIGESLAGLFAVETFFLEPDLFSTCIAIDPSLWWNDKSLIKSAPQRLQSPSSPPRSLFIASSSEPGILADAQQLTAVFSAHPSPTLHYTYIPFPAETHATIYHPAALQALRTLFPPPPPPESSPTAK